MNRKDLKDFRYNKISIKNTREYLSERKTELENISSIISDMPKRNKDSTRQYSRKISWVNWQHWWNDTRDVRTR